MDISIIIVNWNTKDLLLGCLASLHSEASRLENEIIVVDNASTDDSVNAVRERFPRVKIIQNQTNLGFAKANNIGILESSGRYVCLVNSDVVVRDGCLEKLLAFMDQHRTVGIVGPKLLFPNLTLQWSCKRFPTLWSYFCESVGLSRIFRASPFFSGEHMQFFQHDVICPIDSLVGALLFVRKEAIEHVGLLDECFFMYGEETDWCKRLRKAGFEIFFLPEAEAVHYGAGSSSREPARFYKEVYRSKLKYWQKHHSAISQLCFVSIVFARQLIRLIAGASVYVVKAKKRDVVKTQMKGAKEVLGWLLGLN